MIYQLGFFSDIGFSIRQALRTLCGRLAAILYEFIVDLYNVFMVVARAEILDNKYIQAIYNRVGMILGIFMLFKLCFSLIQSLISPNNFTDEKKGFVGIIKRCIISIVLLGITPSLFDMAFDIQGKIVGTENDTNNIIYKIVVADAEYESADSFGRTLATDLYFSFYKEAPGIKLSGGIDINYPDSGGLTIDVIDYDYLKSEIKGGRLKFSDTIDYLTLTSGTGYIIEWNELFSIGMALVIIWLLISYTIQVATRVVQLAYLQLIAPVPILSYIGDPDGSFKRWIKQCTTTYLDLFLRLAVIYFIIALSTQILNIFSGAGGKLQESIGLNPDDSYVIWVKLFLIIGLLMFGKNVPNLLKELFPSSGGAASFGFGLLKTKDIPGSGLVKGAATFGAGVAVGGIAGMASGLRHGEGWRGKVAGTFGGAFRGAASARTKGSVIGNAKKGMANVRAANAAAYQRHHDGSTFMGRMMPVHAERVADRFDKELEAYSNYNSIVDSIDKELEKDSRVQFERNKLDQILKSGTITEKRPRIINGQTIKNPRTGKIEFEEVTRSVTAADIKAYNDNIDKIKESVLKEKITSGDVNIKNYISDADAIISQGYQGFSGGSLSSGDADSIAEALKANKKSSKQEIHEIKDVSGSRNSEYKGAKANAKYKPGK